MERILHDRGDEMNRLRGIVTRQAAEIEDLKAQLARVGAAIQPELPLTQPETQPIVFAAQPELPISGETQPIVCAEAGPS